MASPTTIAPVSAPYYFATNSVDVATLPLGVAMLDFASPSGRLSVRADTPELGAISLTGVDNAGRYLTYFACGEVSVGDAACLFYAPLTAEDDLTVKGNTMLAGLTAISADFQACSVQGSPVLTVADLPPGGIPYPPAGIGVSTGTAWGTSIDSVNPTFAGTVRANLQHRAYGFAPLDLTASHITIGTSNAGGTALATWVNAGSPANQRVWTIGAGVADLHFAMENDGGGDTYWLQVGRSGAVSTGATFLVDIGMTNNCLGVNNSGPNGGLKITWNLLNGTGETDFINNSAGAGGGFAWFNAPPNTALTSSSIPGMMLDTLNNLSLAGSVNAVGYTSTGIPAVTNGSARLSFSSDAAVLDSFGSGGGRGTLHLRVSSAGAANLIDALVIDALGNATFNGTLTVGQGQIYAPGGLSLNAANGNNLFLNWYSGQGTVFGDGAGHNMASVDAAGNAHFTNVYLNGTGIQSDGSRLLLNFALGNGMAFGNGANGIVGTVDNVGNAHFNGTLTAGVKTFRIKHPGKADHWLFHSCLEGPEIGVYYRGEGTTNVKGLATIKLPGYFEKLTRPDGRSVLLTAIHDDSNETPVMTASRVKDGRFSVHSSLPGIDFWWEVKAIRADVKPLAIDRELTEDERKEAA